MEGTSKNQDFKMNILGKNLLWTDFFFLAEVDCTSQVINSNNYKTNIKFTYTLPKC